MDSRGIEEIWIVEGEREGAKSLSNNDIQHNDIQHNDTQHKELLCDTQHKGQSA